MPASFPGFSPKALSFFRQLEKNNKREWFQPRKEKFEELARQPMLELVALLCDDLRGFAVDHVMEPTKALFRIYRDTRFSKDKTPYKTHIAAAFGRQGLSKQAGASFYFSVSHTGVEIAGGMYMPGPPELAAVREAIANDAVAFRKLVSARPLRKVMGELQGNRLARLPKAFDIDHPATDHLRMKQMYFYVVLPAESATKPTLRREIIKRFEILTPFVNFLNEAALKKLRDEESVADVVPKRPAPMF
jgi:uncharacterized protein (TIGR02453 family)